MQLLSLFQQILDAEYARAGNAASYFLRREGDALILLFEESNGKTDWRNNLDFPAALARGKGEKFFAHRGFLRVWQSVLPCIDGAIRDRTVRRILVAGYSHGAALALLCHEHCLSVRPELEENILGVGFGCPRVAWGILPRAVKRRLKRFVLVENGRDIITRLPPALLGYRRVGKRRRVGLFRGYGAVGAHRPECYLAALEGEEL